MTKTYFFTDTSNNRLFSDIPIIKGRSPMDAIKKHLHGARIRRAIYEDEKRLCDYIVEECRIGEDGNPRRIYRSQRLCYIREA